MLYLETYFFLGRLTDGSSRNSTAALVAGADSFLLYFPLSCCAICEDVTSKISCFCPNACLLLFILNYFCFRDNFSSFTADGELFCFGCQYMLLLFLDVSRLSWV